MLFACRTTIFPSCSTTFSKLIFSLNSTSYSTISQTGDRLQKCYEILGLKNDCTKDDLKSKYLELAKKYHPDSATNNVDSDAKPESDKSEKFRQLADAYKFIIDNDYSARDKEDLQDLPKIFDIRHTAPQHRQYLEYGGVGYGTPSQRQRQYQQHRVQQAAENVSDYTIRKVMAKEDYSLITKTGVDAEYARKWKTRNAIDRLVEDLIQESMQKGEFSNLAGQGKPLKYENYNPYVDAMTHKLNQILIQNGFTPEWVLLEKEIKEQKRTIRKLLKDKCQSFIRSDGEFQGDSWREVLNELKETCAFLNKQIDHFNLVCPALSKQMVRFQLQREADKVIKDANQNVQINIDSGNIITDEKQKPEPGVKNIQNHDNSAEMNNSEENVGIFRNILGTLSIFK